MTTFKIIDFNEFDEKYRHIWSKIVSEGKGPSRAPYLHDLPTEGCPFRSPNWRIAFVPEHVLYSRIPTEEYDWDGNFEGLDNFLDPLIWTWKKRGIERVFLTQYRQYGDEILDPINRPGKTIPFVSAELKAGYQAFFDLCEFTNRPEFNQINDQSPIDFGSFIVFDETAEWAFCQYSSMQMGVIGGTPEFMSDFFQLGGGEDMTRRRFYFHDIVWGLGLAYERPEERAALKRMYDWAEWPYPTYPKTHEDEPYNKLQDPYYDNFGNWISDEDPKTVTIPDPDTKTVIRKTD